MAPAGEASHEAALRVYGDALAILQQKFPGRWDDMYCRLSGMSDAVVEKMDPKAVATLLYEQAVEDGASESDGARAPKRGARQRCLVAEPQQLEPHLHLLSRHGSLPGLERDAQSAQIPAARAAAAPGATHMTVVVSHGLHKGTAKSIPIATATVSEAGERDLTMCLFRVW